MHTYRHRPARRRWATANTNRSVDARYWHAEKDAAVCDLCDNRCRIPGGGQGICGVRRFSEGRLEAHTYGRVSSLASDPVEKKPLYHYRPGTDIFSVGSVGCNLHCIYCQNYSISQSSSGSKRTTFKTPEELTGLCRM